ncbi:hypothetical protein [Prevotella intermedia]|uniref:Uncharacterized protein n=1 Tax=Prevotella intermedia TaxID=28131 RepID=A0A0S3UGQ5_PREIN|nr:hypothetical protein [Prevotella intermedia]AWX06562.1 hypothetical protein CTM55_02365 [Prevotella intermedia]BAU16567.1 conserved hypothetical protein [Prevotella intermedia]
MNLKNRFAKLAEERISQRVLYVLIGIAALVFVLFFSVGFYAPFAENPAFNAPLLTDALIVFMWILLGLTVLVMLLSVFHTVKTISVKQRVVNGIPTYKITIAVFGTTFLCLVLSFIFGSSESMVINGATYADKFWLKASDMFVTSSLVLLLAAIGASFFGATRYYRKRK